MSPRHRRQPNSAEDQWKHRHVGLNPGVPRNATAKHETLIVAYMSRKNMVIIGVMASKLPARHGTLATNHVKSSAVGLNSALFLGALERPTCTEALLSSKKDFLDGEDTGEGVSSGAEGAPPAVSRSAGVDNLLRDWTRRGESTEGGGGGLCSSSLWGAKGSKNGTKLSPAIADSNLGAPVNDWRAAPSDDIIMPTLTTTGWGQATSAVT